MTPSSNLFDIIHSLTASEKRYFKVFSSTHIIGYKNNYEKLFNAFCELPADEPYDEDAFKKKLTAKRWTKNFAVEKKVLEDILMKAMRAYNAEKSSEGALNDIIANVNFLYNKGLVNAAMKELKRGVTLAEDLENLPSLITLYQLKLNLTRITQTAADIKTANEDLEAETRILEMLDIERQVVHSRRKIYNLYISGLLKKNITEAKASIVELEHLNTKLLTYKARMSLFFLRAMVAEKEGLYTEAMKQYELANSIWKKNELKLHESYSNLRVILGNYLTCAMYAERFDVYPLTIKEIESFPSESINDQADTFLLTKSLRLVYLLNTTDKSGSEILIREIEQGLKMFQMQLPKRQIVNVTINICFLLFQTRNYGKAADALNNAFVAIGRDDKMHQPLFQLKFMEIMVHFSLKNYDLVDYQLRNTERWLREHKLNEPFTDLLLKSFREIQKASQFTQIKNQLIAFECSKNLQTLQTLVLDWMEINRPSGSIIDSAEASARVNRPARGIQQS